MRIDNLNSKQAASIGAAPGPGKLWTGTDFPRSVLDSARALRIRFFGGSRHAQLGSLGHGCDRVATVEK